MFWPLIVAACVYLIYVLALFLFQRRLMFPGAPPAPAAAPPGASFERLWIEVPGATGYFQDRFRFCAYYGNRGEYNLGSLDADPGVVSDEDARRADKRRSQQIMLYSLVVGIGASVVGAGIVYLVR